MEQAVAEFGSRLELAPDFDPQGLRYIHKFRSFRDMTNRLANLQDRGFALGARPTKNTIVLWLQ